MDNYFTSVGLAEELLKDHKMSIIGTIRKNKSDITPLFLDTKERPVHSTMFGFGEKCLLVSDVPKKGKNLLMISTVTIDESTGDMCKPEVITFYNLTKGGVDVIDEMTASYSVSRISNCWPFTAFFTIMNITCINSLIIYKSLDLMKPHLVARASIPTLPGQLVCQIKQVSGLQVVDNLPPPTEGFCGI
ncbi:hypothetical protein PR048_020347 [Dryococelus australis]|uniref:PiggyBac transposable element-derived protein domain-containing protein n=1 Tax=Dryococelus australis TaxID=614101 RepID=A0ABQ9H616_9NEOP|nr:hypothetical protein PR048_020347 [Dryococelus australis]